MNFKFIFDETSEIGEIQWEYAPGQWNGESAQVQRTEKYVILTQDDQHGVDKYWISRTELKVTGTDTMVTFGDCSMKKEEAKKKLF